MSRLKILITGASGLVGSRVAALLSEEHDVFALCRQPSLEAPIRSVLGDLSLPELPAGLPESADVVVHLAQSARFREFPDGAPDVFAVNVASTARLLDWARRAGVRHFILASSGAVDHPGAPFSYYVASKKSAELLVESYAPILTTLVIRFFFVYGPGQRRSMLVPRLIDNVRAGTDIAIAGDGARLNPIFVEDAARAVAAAVTRQTQGVINIGGPEVLTLREMANAIAASAGREARFVDDPRQMPADLVGDITRMRAELLQPSWTFKQGIHSMLGEW